jgi:serine/threonine protein kinase
LPSSYTISGDLSRVGDDPAGGGGISYVWKGTYSGREVCIKDPRFHVQNREIVEKVSVKYWPISILSCLLKDAIVTQLFFKEAITWKRLEHPNVVAFIGVTQNPLQIVSDWMPNGTLREYVNENPGANRVGLVSFSSITKTWLTKLLQVVGCGRRSQLSSCKSHNARRLKRGRFPLCVVFSCINDP